MYPSVLEHILALIRIRIECVTSFIIVTEVELRPSVTKRQPASAPQPVVAYTFYVNINLYCLVTEAQWREQLAQAKVVTQQLPESRVRDDLSIISRTTYR